MVEAIAFYLFAALTIFMFAVTVMSKNALHSMSALAAGMVFISAFFFLLDADFLGVVQIIVYGGAVMALYAFAMMFMDTTKDVKEKNPSKKIVFFLSGMVALLLVIILLTPIISDKVHALYPVSDEVGNAEAVGIVLFTKYLVPFELAAVMLLVAMIAGIILASKRMDESITLKIDHEIEEKAGK
ncbi:MULTISPECIES: NADH-quinone oxidoreductase subunit J [unclassified Nitratiruptor]|uniref:NADH-quinone oxidoreductase subunit J n=1 Tax=unclassified Nitratiruptor TaxID=2624044 RepID=UPI001915AF95|nr:MULTISPECIES: NADH-quinone oxidoreductase subunit J [unclassified Nitratiruptor]BCD59566.1 NADH-quinone oxidoreductase subunit J [Nitratiruptor sp. YY08-10]BCD63490.1 NADH-quinone oxidoreductase subunit J [Nitratiruptor sp. YY08-14]